jgi:hypothetical protein
MSLAVRDANASLASHTIDVFNALPKVLRTLPAAARTKAEYLANPDLLPPTDDANEISEWLQKHYDRHTRLSASSNIVARGVARPPLDKMPEITRDGRNVSIRFFSIQGSYFDMQACIVRGEKYTGYADTGSQYARRCVRIVRETNKAFEDADNIEIDLRECHGGDINVFMDAFAPLIGRGLLCYYEGPNDKVYMYYARRFRNFNKMQDRKWIPPVAKPVCVIVGPDSSSSAEYIAMILRANIGATIVGSRTGGYLTITDGKWFTHNGKKYRLEYTMAPYLRDRLGRKYDGFIDPANLP